MYKRQTLPNDAANLYVVLSAKGIRSSIRVIARAGTEEAASKLRLAGASIVVSPYIAAGRAMASMALRPIAIDFLDLLAGSECEIEEFELSMILVFLKQQRKDHFRNLE